MIKQVLLFSLLLASVSTDALADIVVIVNKENPIRSISKKQLKNIYLGKSRSFPNSNKVTPLNFAGGALRDKFEINLFGQNNKAALSRYWSKNIFSGKNTPPKLVKGTADMIRSIESNRSSIGYIDEKDMRESVKVILRFK